MPKMKSHSGAKKRFWKTAGGKIKHKHAGKRHLLVPMRSKHRQQTRKDGILNSTDTKTLRLYLPYA